jgi:hypothetical protein
MKGSIIDQANSPLVKKIKDKVLLMLVQQTTSKIQADVDNMRSKF